MKIFNKLPFFYKSQKNKNNGGLPQTLPFDIYFDSEYKMYRQKGSNEISSILESVYLNGSLADGSISDESGGVYLESIMSYIKQNFNFQKSSRVLEIGFGSGLLLKKILDEGIYDIHGIEPGNHKIEEGLENVNLIHDFFPSNLIDGKFDLIYSFAILEHIEDPLDFFNSQINLLTENGRIIFSVPNCEPYLEEGDISIFIHEHYNYFTRESILNLIDKTNCFLEDIKVIAGALIATVSRKKNNNIFSFPIFDQELFVKKINLHLSQVKKIIADYKDSEVAIYVPIRAINSLYLNEIKEVRLVDDNTQIQGNYLPALEFEIESLESLLLNPPKLLLIFSRTFGEKIKLNCLKFDQLKNTKVLTLNELDNY
jgi:2-polyprenyl-3-methyl-5-hydroxy-6-metoxy-1,4-benzoquinol methylase